MKIIAIATALYIGLAKAAPAIVWNSVSSSSDGGSPLHISDLTDARSLLASTLNNGNNDNASNLSAVIFLVGRDADGSEGLNAMAASGKLPQVQAKQASASSIHYHVDGVESSRTVAKDAAAATTLSEDGEEMNVVEVALEEFNRKLDSLAQSEATSAPIEGGEQQQEQEKITKSEQKRRRAISDADILVVTLTGKDNAASIDSSIVKAIDSKLVQNVILSSIRSTDEVKHARRKLVIDKITKSARPSAERRRRLEDEDGQNNQNNNNNNQYQEGVYYVNMTPNIFSGLLFFFMFVFTAHLGLTCMNMIEGQDVYVKKYPTIGREV